MEPKSWYRSWTIWANIGGAVAVAVIDTLDGVGVSGEYAVMALAIANVLLRLKTSPLSLT